MLSVGLSSYVFGESSYMWIFDWRVSTPNSHVVQGSTLCLLPCVC